MASIYFDEDNKLWSALDTPIVMNPKISLGHAILWTLDKNPNKILQINHETNIQLTSGFIRRQTIRAAISLQKFGYEKGDIFAFAAKNSHYVAPLVYSTLCIGCTVSTLDTSFSKAEMIHMLSITKPKLMFCDANIYDLVRECLNELDNNANIYTLSGQKGDSIRVEDLFAESSEENHFSVVELDGENSTAAIACTSGSTGLPKGVCISHAILLHQCVDSLAREDDIVLAFSTIYWISGLLLLLNMAIKGYCRLITTDGFTPELALEMIEEHQVTMFFGSSHCLVLTLKCELFYSANLSSVRMIFSGGSKLSISTALEMLKYLKKGRVMQMYGMSEVGGSISASLVSTEQDTSLGKLLYGIQAKIIDDDGNRQGINECGEICLKAKFKFLGYFCNEEATKNAIDSDGFLMTGDVGYFDDVGNLYLIDRVKDMFKYCSSQVSPTEIEQCLIQYPSIKAVCVVGVPDPIAGDLPAAVIIRNSSKAPITQQEIEQMVADRFADYKRLRGGVYFVDELPLTPSGKIIRRRVREIAIEMYENEMEPDS